MKKKEIRRAITKFKLYAKRNSIIANYPQLKAEENRVNFFDYHPDIERPNNCYNETRYNLGDYLGFVIADWMLAKQGIKRDDWIPSKKFFNCVGSNILSSFEDTTIWGAGVHHIYHEWWRFLHYKHFRKLDIRAVRGPLTRDVLLGYGHKCPEIYGDPAILMPLIYNPVQEKIHDTLIVPQFISEQKFRDGHPDCFIASMNTNDYKSVIDAIVASNKVVTSSLHAIILAEVYGVPVSPYRSLAKKVDFKYQDYFHSTGRTEVYLAESFEEALNAKTIIPPKMQLLNSLQQGLLNSFPYDLWEKL